MICPSRVCALPFLAKPFLSPGVAFSPGARVLKLMKIFGFYPTKHFGDPPNSMQFTQQQIRGHLNYQLLVLAVDQQPFLLILISLDSFRQTS
jgi:hypothetical protein